MTLANKITLARIGGIPIFCFFLALEGFWGRLLAFVFFVLLTTTDIIDGIVARRRKEITLFGQLMDPLADKLLMMAAYLNFMRFEWIGAAWWMVFIIIAREFSITVLRIVAARKNFTVAALTSGKVKTTIQMITAVIIFAVLLLESAAQKFSFETSSFEFIFLVPRYLMYLTTVVTLYSGVSYIIQYSKIIDEV